MTLLLLIAVPMIAHSSVDTLGVYIFSRHFDYFTPTVNMPVLAIDMMIGKYYPDFGMFDVCTTQWPNRMDSTDVGTVLKSTEGTDPFLCTLSHVTNGNSEYVGVGFYLPSQVSDGRSGVTSYKREGAGFQRDATDYNGAEITSYSVRVDELKIFIKPNTNPYGKSEELIDVTCTVTIVIEGTWTDVPVENTTWGRIKSLYKD